MKAHLKVQNVEEISQLYTPTERHTSIKAKICGACPYSDCIASSTLNCKYYQIEVKKLKGVKK